MVSCCCIGCSGGCCYACYSSCSASCSGGCTCGAVAVCCGPTCSDVLCNQTLTGSACAPCCADPGCACCSPTAGQCTALSCADLNAYQQAHPCWTPGSCCNPQACSPGSHGASDQPPHPTSCSFAGKSGGSGSGSAGSSAGGKPQPRPTCSNQTKLSQAVNKLGTILGSLLAKPKTVTTGNKIKSTNPSTTGFIIVIVVVGILLAALAWGKMGEN
jgi:hypothetical protein